MTSSDLPDVAKVAMRALDNVLDATLWPLPEQAEEAANKRRIGLGFTGLGDALTMLGLRYDSDAGRAAWRPTSRARCATQRTKRRPSSRKEKRRVPAVRRREIPRVAPHCASRLPEQLKSEIRAHRHPQLAPAVDRADRHDLARLRDNASSGIEPTFSWTYMRKKRMPDGTKQEYAVEDHAYRLYRRMGGNERELPAAFVSAMQISARDHMR